MTIRQRTANLTVRVVLEDGAPYDQGQLRVQLLGSTGSPIDEKNTDSHGQITFVSVGLGQYHLLISGPNIEEKRSDPVDLSDTAHIEYVPVRLVSASVEAPGGIIAASALSVPGKALKEFERGNQEARQQRWERAEPHYRKALEIHPAFAAAWTNLGLTCARQDKLDCARASWQKAIDTDPKAAAPLVSLARLRMAEHNYEGASALLEHAIALQPANWDALILLSNVELGLSRYEQALSHARQGLTQMAQAGSAEAGPASVRQLFLLGHLVAGSSLEATAHPNDAIAEFEAVLKAFPASSAAGEAQKALDRLRPGGRPAR